MAELKIMKMRCIAPASPSPRLSGYRSKADLLDMLKNAI